MHKMEAGESALGTLDKTVRMKEEQFASSELVLSQQPLWSLTEHLSCINAGEWNFYKISCGCFPGWTGIRL